MIIPVYNYAQYVTRAINSVLNQTLKDVEVIVVDDGSTDETPQVLASIRDPRVRIFRKENTGVASSRNYGARLASASYIAFLDADDEFLPENLEKKLSALKEGGARAVCSDYIMVFPDGKTLRCSPDTKESLLEKLLCLKTTIWASSNLLIEKETFVELGGFDPLMSTSADWEFSCRLAASTPILHIPEPLLIYHMHLGQMHLNTPLTEKDMMYGIKKLKKEGIIQSEYLYWRAKMHITRMIAASYIKDDKNVLKGAEYGARWVVAAIRCFLARN